MRPSGNRGALVGWPSYVEIFLRVCYPHSYEARQATIPLEDCDIHRTAVSVAIASEWLAMATVTVAQCRIRYMVLVGIVERVLLVVHFVVELGFCMQHSLFVHPLRSKGLWVFT